VSIGANVALEMCVDVLLPGCLLAQVPVSRESLMASAPGASEVALLKNLLWHLLAS
jgi:hypothetical protein